MGLFQKKIEPRCTYCARGRALSEDQVICDRNMVSWLKDNFPKVAMVRVEVEEIPLSELVPPQKECPYPVLRRYASMVSSADSGAMYKKV